MVGKAARIAVVLGGIAVAGGCAPVTFAPAGLSLGGTPGLWSTFSQCGSIASPSPEAARMGIRTAAIHASSLFQRAQQIQSRVSAPFVSGLASQAQMRQIADGDC